MTVGRRQGARVLFAVALVALVLEGGSLPHVHDEPGWHNQEHDLAYLVALAAAGLPAAITAAPVLLTASREPAPPSTPHGQCAPWLHHAPRAPPAC